MYNIIHVAVLCHEMMTCGAKMPSRMEFVRKALVEYIDEDYGHAPGRADTEALRVVDKAMPKQLPLIRSSL